MLRSGNPEESPSNHRAYSRRRSLRSAPMTQFPRKYRHSGLAALASLVLLAVAGCNGSGLPVAGSSPAASAPAGASSSPASASPSGVNPGGVNNPSPAPTSPPNETSGDGSRSAVTGGTAFGGDG